LIHFYRRSDQRPDGLDDRQTNAPEVARVSMVYSLLSQLLSAG
jgi:hypothetical protein